jgi:ASC-1-like (ASCH) protein
MEIDISEPYFSLIHSGLKPVEGRKMTPKWMTLSIGDILKVINPNKTPYYVRIIKINYYQPKCGEFDPLTNYLICEGLNQALPGVTTLTEGRRIYLQWSTEAEIDYYGMMGIHFEVLIPPTSS